MYGETVLSGQQEATESSRIGGSNEAEVYEDKDGPVAHGRPRRAAQQNKMKAKALPRKHAEGYDSLGSIDDESDATSSGNEWDGGDEDEPDDHIDDDDDDDEEEEEEEEDVDMSDNSVAGEEGDDPQQSLVVSLRYTQKHRFPSSQDTPNGPPAKPENHSINPTPTGSSKGPPPPLETAPSTEPVTKSSHDAPKPAQTTPHSRSAEHPASLDPKPQVPPPPPPPREKDYTPSLPHPQSQEKPPSSGLAVTFGNGRGGI